MGKKSDPPPAPDYTQAAEKSAASNQYAQTRADWTNRPDQFTPWGSSTWQSEAAIDPSTGQPITRWSQNINLSGEQQQALDDQMAIQAGKSDIAQGMMGRLRSATENPFDTSGLAAFGQGPQAGNLQAGGMMQAPTAGGDLGRQRIENALFERMAPQQQAAQAQLETQLANQGLSRGSAAWNREMQRLGDQQSRERFNALEMGGQEQQRQYGMSMDEARFNLGSQAQQFGQQQAAGAQNFGQGMQAAEYANRLRQQQIGEQQLMRSLPLNELNALLTGAQVANPSFGNFSQSQSAGGVNYSGAAQNQYNAAMNNYNAQQQQAAGTMQGIGQIAGMAGMMMMSDARLKTDIVLLHRRDDGIGIYMYRMFGEPQVGVIAQEVQRIKPEAVGTLNGYLAVDYGRLQ